MDIIEQIKKGEIDCNDNSLFFSILLKGLIYNLNREVKIRNNTIPHMILNTGDDIMYLENKGYDNLKEPLDISNEDYIYNVIPRCIVEPGEINIQGEQVSSPYSRGVFQITVDDQLYNLSAEFRRIPISMNVNLKYYINSYTDTLELAQQVISKLLFIKTFDIIYLGQRIKCTYNIPTSINDDHLTDLNGMTQDNKNHVLEFGLEISTNIPIFDNKTAVSTNSIITNLSQEKINGHNIKSAYHVKL